MAIYHLTVKTGSRSGGQSAKAKANYILRRGKYSRARGDKVLHTQSGNMPGWAEDPVAYWEAADTYERSNGRLFREVEFALPVELTLEQQKELATEFARRLTEDKKLPFTYAIHAAGGGKNPHCHLIISERMNDGIERTADRWFKRYNRKQPEKGGALKTETLKHKKWVGQVRELWSECANRALERAGHDARIDHRSYAERGIDRIPQIHIGPAVLNMERRGIKTERMRIYDDIKVTNWRIERLKREIRKINLQLNMELDMNDVDYREIAKNWRSGQPDRLANNGVVLIWHGEVYGWKSALRDSNHERPGAIAVDVQGRVFRAVGGDDAAGAKGWVAEQPVTRRPHKRGTDAAQVPGQRPGT